MEGRREGGAGREQEKERDGEEGEGKGEKKEKNKLICLGAKLFGRTAKKKYRDNMDSS